jgi:hypothetical protein
VDRAAIQNLFDRIESPAAQVERGWVSVTAPSTAVDTWAYNQLKRAARESPEFAELRQILRTDIGQGYVARRLVGLASKGEGVFPHPDDVAITLYLWAFAMKGHVGNAVSVLLGSAISNLSTASALWGELTVFGDMIFNTEEEVDEILDALALPEAEQSLVLERLNDRARKRATRFDVRAASLVQRWTRAGDDPVDAVDAS